MLSALSGRLPRSFEVDLFEVLKQSPKKFPAQRIENLYDAALIQATRNGSVDVVNVLKGTGIVELAKKYHEGTKGHVVSSIADVLKSYVEAERFFAHAQSYEAIMSFLMNRFASDRSQIIKLVFAHSQIDNINFFVSKVMEIAVAHNLVTDTGVLKPVLQSVASSHNSKTIKVALQARQIILNLSVPTFETRKSKLDLDLIQACQHAAPSQGGYDSEKLNGIVATPGAVFDVMGDFFFHSRPPMRGAALETYVRRAYIAYQIDELTHIVKGGET